MILIKLSLLVSKVLFYSKGTRANRTYKVPSVQCAFQIVVVPPEEWVRESIEQSWQENRLLESLAERDRSRLIPQLDISHALRKRNRARKR